MQKFAWDVTELWLVQASFLVVSSFTLKVIYDGQQIAWSLSLWWTLMFYKNSAGKTDMYPKTRIKFVSPWNSHNAVSMNEDKQISIKISNC
jgi:hypothetical protein